MPEIVEVEVVQLRFLDRVLERRAGAPGTSSRLSLRLRTPSWLVGIFCSRREVGDAAAMTCTLVMADAGLDIIIVDVEVMGTRIY
jgi:hypothetical protein